MPDVKTAIDRGWGNPYELSSRDMVVFNVAGLLSNHPARLIRVRSTDVGVVFAEGVRRLVVAGWPGPDANTWGYNGRLKRWAQNDGLIWGKAPMSAVSEHAWGTAADFSTGINPMLARRPADPWSRTNMPREAVKIAADLGLDWGGNWTSPFDPQHWEIAGTPADVAATARAIRDQHEGDDEMTDAQMAELKRFVTETVHDQVQAAVQAVLKGGGNGTFKGLPAGEVSAVQRVESKLDALARPAQ